MNPTHYEELQKGTQSWNLYVVIQQKIDSKWEADLREADLREADLREANLDPLAIANLSIVPESGAFEGWKKCRDQVIIRVRIPAESKRSNATGRKCRTEYVEVLEVIGADEGISEYNPAVVYRKGETVRCHEWDDNRWEECSGGIHFFLTRIEAENY
jgi:hypothetical protein